MRVDGGRREGMGKQNRGDTEEREKKTKKDWRGGETRGEQRKDKGMSEGRGIGNET